MNFFLHAGLAISAFMGYLLFAIGVAVGLARENHGAAGLAAVVGYLVATKGAEVLINVPPGAISDLSADAHDLAVLPWALTSWLSSKVLAGHLQDRRGVL